jgi:predicted RNase H-like HicB family nuclease
LPVNESEQVHGLENLRLYLQQHEGVFVKISAFRGLGETFESENYDQSKGQLDDLRAKHGALMDVVDFIVENKIPDAKEVGYDGYCIDGEFPDSSFFGIEVKDKGYFGQLVDYDKLPKSVKEANTRLSYHMQGYRQFWSTELREKDGKGYVIDLTARHASPAGETFMQALENLPEVLFFGAEGKLVHGEWSAKYAAQIILCSEWAEEKWQPIAFPDEIRPFVKIYNHCRIDGKDYCVPQIAKMKQVGSVVALGNTPEEAIKLAKERANKIKGYDLEAEVDALDKAAKEMEGFLK